MAVLEHQSRGLVSVAASLSGHDARLAFLGFPEDDHGVLEDALGVAEDEIYGPRDGAVAVELALGVDE